MEQTTNEQDRFDSFTEAERIIISEALKSQTVAIAAEALDGELDSEDRELAASTFIVGASLGLEVARSLGQEGLPDIEMFEGTAAAIADGSYAEQVRAVRQEELVEEAQRQLDDAPTGTLTEEDAA